MPVVTSDAVILQVFAYGETSRILRLLTATNGLQSTIAKGARAGKSGRSRFGNVLEPFSQGVATVYVRETRELQTLAGFELTRSGQALGTDLLRFGGASLIAEIVLRATHENSSPGLYDHVTHVLQHLEEAPRDQLESVVLARTWGLIAALGYAPELDHCIECDRAVPAEDDVRFDYGAGGIRCAHCAAGSPGRDIPARARLALRAMARGETPPVERTRGHWWILTRYLDHHVLEGATLHSLAFLEAARGPEPCAD